MSEIQNSETPVQVAGTVQQDKPKSDMDQGRYSLNEKGEIYWQANATNPLPGVQVGHVEKGLVSPLSPKAISNGEKLDEELQVWLDAHIKDVLGPIFDLKTDDDNALSGAAAQIGDALYDNMGVIHRSEIEQFVPDLTPELRQPLRRKRVKMGPILVFLHDLMKPAAVNMRALLWGLWHGKALPMETPADGRVSVTVNPDEVDRHYYRSIGYPVFGNKALRIDMLDRVVTDIYDAAENWQFQAKHRYAEWLGCNIEDLYGVLSSMGHVKIETPQDKQVEASDAPMEAEAEKADPEGASVAPPAEVKPELAFFKLKKGKISARPGQRKDRPQAGAKSQDKGDGKKPFKRKDRKPRDTGVKTFSAKPKPSDTVDDNPFAILKQLKGK